MKKHYLTSLFFFVCMFSFAQVGINTTTPSPASALDINSSVDGTSFGGFLPPKVTNAERADITSKATVADDGLLIYNIDARCLQVWDGTNSTWEDIYCMPAGGAVASDLFISEYVEGSGNNKIIEIANFTGATVNLVTYEINGYQNGSSTVGYTYNFPSVSLADGDVYVIAHPSTTIACDGATDEDFGWQFNGNDVVELVTTAGTTIDIIGTIGSSVVFAEDATLRKNVGEGPSAVFDISDYTSFPQDTCIDLGSHTF